MFGMARCTACIFFMGSLAAGKGVACSLPLMIGMVGVGCMGTTQHVFELCNSTSFGGLVAPNTG